MEHPPRGVTKEQLLELAKPFDAHEVSWRINRAGKQRNDPTKVWAMAVPYLQADAIFDRLDDVLGPGNWQTDVRSSPGHVFVGIGVLVDGEWVWKWDGTGLMESNAGLSQQDAGKGDVTNGVKRAAVQLGIGRYLRNVREQFVDTFPADGDNGQFYAPAGQKHPAFRWNRPGSTEAKREVAAPDPQPGKAKPSDAPNERMSAQEADAEIERLQGNVRRFMRQNRLKPYHFDALLQADEKLPETVKELRLPEWQHIWDICERRKMRWDEAPKLMAQHHPTEPERVELLDNLIAELGAQVRPEEAAQIASAKASGWNDAVEYWIDTLIGRQQERAAS